MRMTPRDPVAVREINRYGVDGIIVTRWHSSEKNSLVGRPRACGVLKIIRAGYKFHCNLHSVGCKAPDVGVIVVACEPENVLTGRSGPMVFARFGCRSRS